MDKFMPAEKCEADTPLVLTHYRKTEQLTAAMSGLTPTTMEVIEMFEHGISCF